MLPILEKLLGGGIKALGDTAANVINAINAPKEEKDRALAAIQAETDRHIEAVMAQSNDIEKAYLASIASAQDMNKSIQDSDKASWMAKNIAYLIDVFVTCLWGGLTAYLMLIMLNLVKSDNHTDYTAVTAVWGAVTGVFTQVLSFHRGSSQGSADKQKLIDKMTQKA